MTEQLGKATITPRDPIRAGTYGTWTLTYTVGSYGIDSGGQIKVAIRLASDWGNPQFDEPAAENFTTVTTDGAAKIRASWQPRGYVRPKSKAIVLDVYDGSLSPGDTVTVVLGDRQHGSPGMRAQTYLESEFEFFVLVDPTNSTDPRPIADRLHFPVIAADLVAIDCLIPTQAAVGDVFSVFIKGEDLWRNPIPVNDDRDVRLSWQGTGRVTFDGRQVHIHEAGIGYILADYQEISCRSNPLQILAEPAPLKRFWGDLHAQTNSTVGVGSDDEYFRFGRDWAYLDFMSHQGNDFQISDRFWAELNRLTEQYNDDGRFVVFPGYEWSGSSPTGGDHNVIYRREGGPILRSSHWLVPDTPVTDLTPAHPADVFYEKLKQAVPTSEVLVCQHVGGRYANLRRYFDQEVITLVELVSVWGVFEWMLWDAIDRGYIVGVMCNSDGHHGRPGAEGAGMTLFGIRNGLTCVLSDTLTRDGIFDALKQRHCYGTTGARIWLDFTAGDYVMGSVIAEPPEPLVLSAAVVGCGPLESLQLYRGRDLIAETQPPEFDTLETSQRIRVSWQGSRERGRQRRVVWDGSIEVTDTTIESAELFSFDVVADGIRSQTVQEIVFASKTTGDRDGLDLILGDAWQGELVFASAAGEVRLDLSHLTAEDRRQVYDFGGVDMQVIIERYPETITTLELDLAYTADPVPTDKKTPYFVKATQADGEMAWASPIWITPYE